MEKEQTISTIDRLIEKLVTEGVSLGKHILVAIVIYVVGRFIVKLINRLVTNAMEKRKIDPAVRSFVGSTVNITLQALLILSVIGALGIQMTSFSALLVSAGAAIGMALSGNLQNFAGGLIILLLRPYKIGDLIEIGDETGTVKSIQMFNTVLTTFDNKIIFVPNSSISNGVMTNYSRQETRRVDLVVGVEYGTEFAKVQKVLEDIIAHDPRILADPKPFIAVNALSASSVDIVLKAWVKTEDYWDVSYDLNRIVYERFNQEGIGFPFPQLTVHQGK
ncbi:MAG: mechanosensitive ion channel [bacterium]|uniref:Mechanosensitive ion channel n=1 Tax=Candidatus Aphodosoma intestinipullorum TaxID=2840674 RepID=A0A940DNU6_9BACT|nr:mechanosensitive ion channel [Candidatus Aphodosoma intestinipullorum]